jgi:hypothetical protein
MTEPNASAQVARHHAVEQAQKSPDGLRQTARGLRERAQEVVDANDRAAMLRLASEFERRADLLDQRVKIPPRE